MNQLTPNSEQTLRTFFETLGQSVKTIDTYELFGSKVVNVHLQDAYRFPKDERRAVEILVVQLCDDVASIDINGHNKKIIEKLQERARAIAERARELDYPVEMEPMNSFERMVVHEAIKNIEGVSTISKGEGPLRHVVIQNSNTSD